MELYIHIPFCIRKCNYCDFLSAPADEKSQIAYVKKLCEEIEYYGHLFGKYPLDDNHRNEITSVFIGGGTPSILPLGTVADIMDCIKKYWGVRQDTEISIECNPGTVTMEKLNEYMTSGINRISFGLQSADNEELKVLGRIHTYEEFLESFNMARKIGFTNINIDLMSGLFNQTAESFYNTLEKVVALNPEHISSYSLIIEEGTPFFDYVMKQEEKGIDVRILEETDRDIYALTKKVLKKYGYKRYEISNYAKPGYECKHNLGYWQGEEYLGLGLGASSYINIEKDDAGKYVKAIRFKNTEDMSEYLKRGYEVMLTNNNTYGEINIESKFQNIIRNNMKEVEDLNKEDLMSEFMITGLRVCKGINKKAFLDKFEIDVKEVYGNIIKKYIATGHLEEDEDYIRLTDKGIDVSNYILCDFV